MTLTNPVQPRALSEEGLGRMRRALFRSFPIQRQDPKLRCQELLSVFITQDLRVMAQDTSHEPRNSIGKVFSQDPCEMSGCLRDLCVVSLWTLISSQDLETISFQKPHHQRGLPTRNVVGPIQGLPLSILESILGTEIVRVLLALVGQGRQ